MRKVSRLLRAFSAKSVPCLHTIRPEINEHVYTVHNTVFAMLAPAHLMPVFLQNL